MHCDQRKTVHIFSFILGGIGFQFLEAEHFCSYSQGLFFPPVFIKSTNKKSFVSFDLRIHMYIVHVYFMYDNFQILFGLQVLLKYYTTVIIVY